MKKISLVLGLVLLLSVTSCCKKEQTQGADCKAKKECCKKEQKCSLMGEEEKAACAEFKAKWENFENLTAEEKEELVAKKKDCIEKCNLKAKEKVAQADALLIELNNLTTADEKKALIDKMSCCKKENKKECKKDAACKKEAAKCEKKVECAEQATEIVE